MSIELHQNEYTGEHVIGEIVYMIRDRKAEKCVIVDLWNDGKNGFTYEVFNPKEEIDSYVGYWVYE